MQRDNPACELMFVSSSGPDSVRKTTSSSSGEELYSAAAAASIDRNLSVAGIRYRVGSLTATIRRTGAWSAKGVRTYVGATRSLSTSA
jgi:hypothetical protein